MKYVMRKPHLSVRHLSHLTTYVCMSTDPFWWLRGGGDHHIPKRGPKRACSLLRLVNVAIAPDQCFGCVSAMSPVHGVCPVESTGHTPQGTPHVPGTVMLYNMLYLSI